jgi:hypothetical protein
MMRSPLIISGKVRIVYELMNLNEPIDQVSRNMLGARVKNVSEFNETRYEITDSGINHQRKRKSSALKLLFAISIVINAQTPRLISGNPTKKLAGISGTRGISHVSEKSVLGNLWRPNMSQNWTLVFRFP